MELCDLSGSVESGYLSDQIAEGPQWMCFERCVAPAKPA